MTSFGRTSVEYDKHACFASCSELGSWSAGEGAAAEDGKTWDIQGLAGALASAYPTVSWQAVFAALDVPSFSEASHPSFEVLLSFWTHLGQGAPFPVGAFIKHKWQNASAQLAFLCHAVCQVCNADCLSWLNHKSLHLICFFLLRSAKTGA
jgi:hypothetical protein